MTTLLVIGATGRTGRHVVAQALAGSLTVRALVRDPGRVAPQQGLEVRRGSVDGPLDLDDLVEGVDAVVVLYGDAEAQRHEDVAAGFVRRLAPAMRRRGVRRIVFQAGGFSIPPGTRAPLLRLIRAVVARRFLGQHRDNEAVMRFLTDEAPDLEWIVHRAGLGGDGPSKGVLVRSSRRIGVATFGDCATYTLRLATGSDGIRTCDPSRYRARR